MSGLPHGLEASPHGDALLKPGKDYELRGSEIVESATQRAMAGPEIPHNEAGVPIIPDSATADNCTNPAGRNNCACCGEGCGYWRRRVVNLLREGLREPATADAPPEVTEEMVEDLGESTVVAGGRCYQLGTHPGSADVHIRKGYMILRCEAEHVVGNKDGAITFGLNGDDIARLLEVLARSGNCAALTARTEGK
jgi:hypothetical protein